eukprot:gene29614-17896_t
MPIHARRDSFPDFLEGVTEGRGPARVSKAEVRRRLPMETATSMNSQGPEPELMVLDVLVAYPGPKAFQLGPVAPLPNAWVFATISMAVSSSFYVVLLTIVDPRMTRKQARAWKESDLDMESYIALFVNGVKHIEEKASGSQCTSNGKATNNQQQWLNQLTTTMAKSANNNQQQ